MQLDRHFDRRDRWCMRSFFMFALPFHPTSLSRSLSHHAYRTHVFPHRPLSLIKERRPQQIRGEGRSAQLLLFPPFYLVWSCGSFVCLLK